MWIKPQILNSQKGKDHRRKEGKLERGGLTWEGLMGIEKIMIADGESPETVVNSCLEAMEGKMRLKRLRTKLIPQVEKKKEEQMSGGEQ